MHIQRPMGHKIFVIVLAGTWALVGCGSGSGHEALVSVSVTPSAGNATHGSANNTVQFSATGNFEKPVGAFGNERQLCSTMLIDSSRPLSQVGWETSDTANTSIDANGVATCLAATAAPATITALASGTCGGVKGTATLTCN